MPITAVGTVPTSILERNQPGDWVGTLDLTGSSGSIDSTGSAGPTNILLTGQDASLFLASLDTNNRVTIRPALSFDREAYAPGADPTFSFGLAVQSGGIWTTLADTWSVTLAGVDDTAPSGLRFSSGGAVLETDVAGIVGTLVADDPDSALPTSPIRCSGPTPPSSRSSATRSRSVRASTFCARAAPSARWRSPPPTA